jgi:hypothetical protein
LARLRGLSIGLTLVFACRPGEPEPPAPPFEGQPIEQVDREVVLQYARQLPYVPISGDSQRLMLGTCPANCRYGPLAHIDPVRGAYAHDSAEQRAGRLLARVINVDTIPYPKLNLGPRDTVYWWVDGARGRQRSLLISTRRDVPPLELGFRREPHPELTKDFHWRQAVARFLWRDRDEQLWVACSYAECCRTDESFQ